MGTIAVLLLALAKGLLTLQEFRECLDSLLTSGFWLTVDVYNEALEAARSMANSKN